MPFLSYLTTHLHISKDMAALGLAVRDGKPELLPSQGIWQKRSQGDPKQPLTSLPPWRCHQPMTSGSTVAVPPHLCLAGHPARAGPPLSGHKHAGAN